MRSVKPNGLKKGYRWSEGLGDEFAAQREAQAWAQEVCGRRLRLRSNVTPSHEHQWRPGAASETTPTEDFLRQASARSAENARSAEGDTGASGVTRC